MGAKKMMQTQGYHTDIVDQVVRLQSPACSFTLDKGNGLRAISWENRLTGSIVSLGQGLEFEVDLDIADRRIYIEGWRGKETDLHGPVPDEESGFRECYYGHYFDDSGWRTTLSPALFSWLDPQEYYWFRTHMFIPPDAEGKPLTLVLGGFGIWDFRYMRVFVNGREVGERRTEGRWFEPGEIDLGPETAFHSLLRFGQDNVIALQMASPIRRTSRLDELDPRGAHSLPYNSAWAGQFEQYLMVGTPALTPQFEVTEVQLAQSNSDPALTVHLVSSDVPVCAQVTYRWEEDGHVIRKHVSLRNAGDAPCRLLHVRLGDYQTNAEVSDGEQGFPVYLNGEMFASLNHPSGWATGQDGCVRLRQYPGRILPPGEAFESMDAVLGTAAQGEARRLFLDYVQARMRRIVRGRGKTIAIFEPFGSRPDGIFDAAEEFMLDSISKLEEGQREAGYHFDYFSIDFWADIQGDLTAPAPERFPVGFTNIKSSLAQADTALGLWIDSSSGGWNIGNNPVVASCRVGNPGYPYSTVGMPLCRAADPFRTMFTTAFRQHIRENDARLFKFDNLNAICHNTSHVHLPGVYSTEAIQSAVIDTFRSIEQECPEVFIMLYWGHRSPWWLLHADTLFEPGIMMEASTPSPRPSLYARDGVGVGLDQAHAWAEDIPKMGKDSLGVWLSSWPWNSSIGKERWQEGIVLDMCRGSLIIQPWSDTDWLTPLEREEFAYLLALVREGEDCFRNSHPILASAWEEQPYGYACTHKGRGFVAINNCTWNDELIQLQLTETWGLDSERKYRLYRHYPSPAELVSDNGVPFNRQVPLRMRPFDVVLLEVVPEDEMYTGSKVFSRELASTPFAEPTRKIDCSVQPLSQAESDLVERDPKEDRQWRGFRVAATIPPTAGGTLVITAEIEKNGRAVSIYNIGSCFRAKAVVEGQQVQAIPVLAEQTYPAAWQAWRITSNEAATEQTFTLDVAESLGEGLDLLFAGYFVPRQ